MKTALDLLEEQPIEAVALLERLRVEVPLHPSDPVPFERLPVMPTGTMTDVFVRAWKAAYYLSDQEIRARMLALQPWLLQLGIDCEMRLAPAEDEPVTVPERVAKLVEKLTAELLKLDMAQRETALEPMRDKICFKCYSDDCTGWCDYHTPRD